MLDRLRKIWYFQSIICYSQFTYFYPVVKIKRWIFYIKLKLFKKKKQHIVKEYKWFINQQLNKQYKLIINKSTPNNKIKNKF